MARVEGIAGLSIMNAGSGLRGRHRAEPAAAEQSASVHLVNGTRTPGLATVFTRFALDYAAQLPGRSIMVLQAGCTTAGHELDLAALRARGHEVVECLVDDEGPATHAVVAKRPELGSATLGELRLLPLVPRSFDIVQCSLLLDRISNAELVLSRLVSAIRPNGLLLLRTADRDTAAGFLDRMLPSMIRTLMWRWTRPGEPGPFPAVYEPIASAQAIEAFSTRHGLSVAHRQTCSRLDSYARPGIAAAARKLVGWLSRGRFGCTYDELCYVVRKPEDRFARVLP